MAIPTNGLSNTQIITNMVNAAEEKNTRLVDDQGREYFTATLDDQGNVTPTYPTEQEVIAGDEINIANAMAAAETAAKAADQAEAFLAGKRTDETITSAETIKGSSTRSRGDSFNIARFRNEVVTSDSVLPTHSFLVVFAPMQWITTSAARQGLDSLLTMRCENAILPSINLLQEQNIRRYGFGPVENVAYGVNVGDFTLQFIVDKQALIVDFFEAWLNRIVNRDSYGGANMNNKGPEGRRPYEVAYKDSYACPSVNVFVYDRAQNNVLEYNIYDVFPTGIQSMNMSWSEENTLLKLNVTFSFTDLRIRPKVSAFGQSADTVPPAPIDPALREFIARGNRPLVDTDAISAEAAKSVAALTDLSALPVVVGAGNDGAPRSFGTPSDTAPLTGTAPEVTIPITRDAFGQLLQST